MSEPDLYVTDTHALIFYLDDDPRLSLTARNVFEKADAGEAVILVPLIVLAELERVIAKGRVNLDFDERRSSSSWRRTAFASSRRGHGASRAEARRSSGGCARVRSRR